MLPHVVVMLSNYETGCTIQKYWTHLIVLVILPHVLFSSVLPYRSTEPTWLFLYFYPMYSVLVYFFTEVQNPLDCSCTSTSCTLFWCTSMQKYRTHMIVPVLLPHVLCSSILLDRSTEPTWLFLYFYFMYSVLVYFFTEVQNPLYCSFTSTSCTLF